MRDKQTNIEDRATQPVNWRLSFAIFYPQATSLAEACVEELTSFGRHFCPGQVLAQEVRSWERAVVEGVKLWSKVLWRQRREVLAWDQF